MREVAANYSAALRSKGKIRHQPGREGPQLLNGRNNFVIRNVVEFFEFSV
jgi:hypothetical protein